MSLSYAETIAGKQPDGTQGIAVVDFQGSDGSLKKLVGCAIHFSPSDKSLKNILKVDGESFDKVKYFIFLPWFNSCRPTSLDEITSISVKLHRYKTPYCEKTFSMSMNTEFFETYKDDDYIVIPCEEKNFTRSPFLKKWSSKLLLHNNFSQILSAKSHFIGFKKDGDQHQGKSLFKYCKFDLKKSGAQSGYYVYEELEEQGVLLMIPNETEQESYVVGCYLKNPSEIKLFCFLLQGLAEISTEEQPGERHLPLEQSHSTEDGRRGTPPEQSSPEGTVESPQHPPGTAEHRTNDSDSAEQGRQRAPLGKTENDLCRERNHLTPEAVASGGSSGPHSSLTEGTDGVGGSSGCHASTRRTDYPGTSLGQHPSTERSDATDHFVSQSSAITTQAHGGLAVPQPQPALTSPLAFQPDGEEKVSFEDFLKEFAEQVGVRWKFLGRHLGIQENLIEIIEDENKSVIEKAIQMFFKWRELKGKEATPQKLVSVLEHKMKNRLLAEKVTEWMATGKSPS